MRQFISVEQLIDYVNGNLSAEQFQAISLAVKEDKILQKAVDTIRDELEKGESSASLKEFFNKSYYQFNKKYRAQLPKKINKNKISNYPLIWKPILVGLSILFLIFWFNGIQQFYHIPSTETAEKVDIKNPSFSDSVSWSEREERVRSLFENCQNTLVWKDSLRKVLLNEKIEVIVGGAFRIGTLVHLLEKENVCDFSFNSISYYDEREQLNITHKKRKALADLKCTNEKDLFNLSRYVLNKFTMFCTSMSNNNLDITKRFEAYEKALHLFIDDQRTIGLIRGKGQGEITFNVKDYFNNELLTKRKKYDFVQFRILDSLSQIFILTNVKEVNGRLKGELVFHVEYSAGMLQRRKGDADQEVILYTDVTRKRVEVFINLVECFNNNSEFIANQCCLPQLGDIKAEEIIEQKMTLIGNRNYADYQQVSYFFLKTQNPAKAQE